MKVIGLTGGIASGKTTVARLFRQANIPVICADEIARSLTEPGTASLEKIVQHFGADILSADGSLDRIKLAKTVFTNPDERKILESLLHPAVRKTLQSEIETEKAKGTAFLVLDIPLLFESNLDVLCDETICVYVDEANQIERHINRSGHSRAHTLDRMRAQMPLTQKLNLATHVLHNQDTLTDLQAQFEALLEKLGIQTNNSPA